MGATPGWQRLRQDMMQEQYAEDSRGCRVSSHKPCWAALPDLAPALLPLWLPLLLRADHGSSAHICLTFLVRAVTLLLKARYKTLVRHSSGLPLSHKGCISASSAEISAKRLLSRDLAASHSDVVLTCVKAGGQD